MPKPDIGKKVLVEVPSTTANLGPGFDCLGAALTLNNQFRVKRIAGDGKRFELINSLHREINTCLIKLIKKQYEK